MVCVLAPELNQSISRSSSLKGLRSTRKPTRTSRFEDIVSAPEIIRQHKEASVSPERDTEPHEERIVESVKELYSCSASKSAFGVYAPEAVLRDDTGSLSLTGFENVREHFAVLQRTYPIANVLKFRISPGATTPSTSIIVDIEVEYRRTVDALRPSKIVKGFVILELSDSQGCIVRQTEKWEHASQRLAEEASPSPVHRRTSLSHDESMYA